MTDPGFIKTFIKMDDIGRVERQHLSLLGLSQASLFQLSWQFRGANLNKCWEDILLRDGAPGSTAPVLEVICPFSGDTRKSVHGFCIYLYQEREPLFYLFDGDPKFYLIFSSAQGVFTAVYIPQFSTLISFRTSSSRDVGGINTNTNDQDFNRAVIESWVASFNLLSKWYADETRSYLESPADKPALIVGFKHNRGHHVYHDLKSLDLLRDAGLEPSRTALLCGPADYFDIQSLFPDLNIVDIVDGSETVFSETEIPEPFRIKFSAAARLFERGLNDRLFPIHVTYEGDIPQNLKRRILERAENQCSEQFLDGLRQAEDCLPLVWITLRDHNRVWVEQEDGLAQLIDSLYSNYPEVGVVFDGFPAVADLMTRIVNKLRHPVKTYDALNCAQFETLMWCRRVDFYVSPFGDGVVSLAVADVKRGVMHTHEAFAQRNNFFPLSANQEETMICLGGPTVSDGSYLDANYSLDWRLVRDQALVIAEQALRDRHPPATDV